MTVVTAGLVMRRVQILHESGHNMTSSSEKDIAREMKDRCSLS